MATDKKDTIYVDIDDEITAVIDKVTSSGGKIVALVLPKRASVFQSQVNMKLLKRAADDVKKHIVLVTSESGLMPLAGAAGLHVAKTPTSKPEVPPAPDDGNPIEDVAESEETNDDFDTKAEANKPLGELAGLAVAGAVEDDTIELDNSSTPKLVPIGKDKKVKAAKDKSKRVPNFSKFRNRGLIAVLILVALGVLAYFAFAVWPHATVSIYTEQTSLAADFKASLDTGASKVDPSNNAMPAVAETSQKSYSQTVPATGQKDEGHKASGTIAMSVPCNAISNGPVTVPAGTGVSTNNLTYITQKDATLNNPDFSNGCSFTGQTEIVAQSSGDNYNVDSATFAVNGYDNVSASGSASGGSTNIVRVVQDSDIKAAKQKLKGQDEDSIKQTLKSQLEQNNLTVLPQTFAALPSDVELSADAGEQANNVTVTENVTYVMFGYKTSDLQQLVAANLNNQFDSAKQSILDYGLGAATFQLDGKPSSSKVDLQITSNVKVGPKFDVDALKKEVAGKKAGNIRSNIGNHGGVSKVEVDLSPFWVGTVPNNTSKITIKFVKSSND